MKFQSILKKINPVLILILLFAGIIRFIDYPNRWALAYDQAWFAINARHALSTFQLPLLGPFASGGPFQTGGEWFWVVMMGTIWAPNILIAPWIFITALSIFQVYLIYLLGKKIINKHFGIILALLMAVSPSQTLQATNLTNQTTISIWSILIIWSIYSFIKNKESKYLFFVGMSLGLSSSQHLQGVLLLPLIIIFILVERIFDLRKLLYIAFGIFLPWFPVLLVDAQNGFYNTKSMLTYFSNNQSKASYEVLGRRWLTFITEYIPYSLGRIVGGNKFIGIIEFSLLIFTGINKLINGKITNFWFTISTYLIVVAIALRYIRTPLFENYITFLHPFIILVIGLLIFKVFNKNFFLGAIICLIISVFSVVNSVNEFKNSTNLLYPETKIIVEQLVEKYPNNNFSVFDYNDDTAGRTLSLVLYLDTIGKIHDDGRKIGLSVKTEDNLQTLSKFPIIIGNNGSVQIFDLNESKSSELKLDLWYSKNPKTVYDSVQNWFRIK